MSDVVNCASDVFCVTILEICVVGYCVSLLLLLLHSDAHVLAQ